MLARLSLVTGLLACLTLGVPAIAVADDARVTIGVPNVEIHAPPLSIQIGSPPYYYPHPHHHYHRYYYPAPRYYYPPRYYHNHRYHPHQRYHRDFYHRYYRDHRNRR